MMNWWIANRILYAVLGGTLTFVISGAEVTAQEMEVGMRDFQLRCAACHGPRAGGDGPIAELMKEKPRNLRRLASENDGVFPFIAVYQTIDGRRDVKAHGTREMPVWGDYFEEEALERGLPSGLDADQIVQGRILSLVYYLQAIQEH